MTAGTIAIGTLNTPFQYFKVWSGTDGAYLSSYRTLARPAYTKIVYGKRSVFNGRKYVSVPYIMERVDIPPRYVVRHRRSHSQWNNYTMSVKVVSRGQSAKSGWIGDYDALSPLHLTSSENVSLQSKLVNAIRGHSFNAAVSNAQIGLTLDMIVSTVSRSARCIRSLKHGNLVDAARSLGVSPRGPVKNHHRPLNSRDVADAWLELQYGWKPLFKDVHDGAEAMAHILNPARADRLTVSQVGRKVTSVNNASLPFMQGFASGICHVRILTELTESLSTSRSLGLLNPLSVAWEILPFSFVADWFIPVGVYLDNYNIIPNISGRFLTSEKSSHEFLMRSLSGWAVPGFSNQKRIYLTRSASTSLTVQKPEFHIPPGSHTGRFWNSLALLRQVVS